MKGGRRRARHHARGEGLRLGSAKRSGGRGRGRPMERKPQPSRRALDSQFPILGREINGRPLGVPRARQPPPRRPRRARRDEPDLPGSRTRTSTGAVPARAGGHRGFRGGARDHRADWIGASGRGDDLHEERHRGDQPRRLLVGAPERGAGKGPGADHADGAPLEHRAVADALPGGRRRAALTCRSSTTSPLDLERPRLEAGCRAETSSPYTDISNVLGTAQPLARTSSGPLYAGGALVLVDGAQAAPPPRRRARPRRRTSTISRGTRSTARPAAGVLYSRRSLLEEMPPFAGGGT